MEPKLRFKEFNGDWEEKRLGNIADVLSGKRIPKGMSLSTIDTGIKYITVSDMGDKYINIENIKYISEDIEKKIKKYKVSENDIIISVAGTLGKINIVTKDFQNANLTENCDKITNLKGIKYEYLYMYLNSSYIQDQINSIYTVSSQPKLALIRIRNFIINTPSLPEQTKIADFLSTVDDKIQNQQDKITHLENIKKGFMQKIFSRKIRFKDDEGNEFPDWEEMRLGDKLIIHRGASPRPIEKYLTYDKNGLNWIKIGDVSLKTNVITKTQQKIIPEGLTKTRQVFEGDLILSNSMSFGRPYIMGINGCIHDGWLLIRDYDKNFNLKYLCYLLSSTNVLNQYKKLSAGSTVKNLNSELVKSVKIEVPCIKEQQKIANFLSSFDEKISTERETLEHLKQLKKGFLQQIFV